MNANYNSAKYIYTYIHSYIYMNDCTVGFDYQREWICEAFSCEDAPG